MDHLDSPFSQDWKMTLKNGLEMLIERARLPETDRDIVKGMFEGLEGIGYFLSEYTEAPLEFLLLWQSIKIEAESGKIAALAEDAGKLAELVPELPSLFDPQLLLQGSPKQSPFIRILTRLQRTVSHSKHWKEAEGIMEMLNTYVMTYFQQLIPPKDQLEFWDLWLDVYAAFKECDRKDFSSLVQAIKNLTAKVQKIVWQPKI